MALILNNFCWLVGYLLLRDFMQSKICVINLIEFDLSQIYKKMRKICLIFDFFSSFLEIE